MYLFSKIFSSYLTVKIILLRLIAVTIIITLILYTNIVEAVVEPNQVATVKLKIYVPNQNQIINEQIDCQIPETSAQEENDETDQVYESDISIDENQNTANTEITNISSIRDPITPIGSFGTQLHFSTEHLSNHVTDRILAVSGVLNNTSLLDITHSNKYVKGTSSGNELYEYGAWNNITHGISRYNKKNNIPGYKSKYYGLLIGFDNKIQDELSIGVTLGYLKVYINHTDYYKGNKTNSNLFTLSFYGLYELTPEYFLQGLTTFGYGRINNKELYGSNIGTVRSSYSMTSIAGEIFAGYNKKIWYDLNFIPIVGLKLARFNSFNYKEYNSQNNLTITGKDQNQLAFALGTKLSGNYLLNISDTDLHVTPEIHGTIYYRVFGKVLDITLNQSLGPTYLESRTKFSMHTIYNLGCSITNKHSTQLEYSLGYDIRFANKYVSHQALLKITYAF